MLNREIAAKIRADESLFMWWRGTGLSMRAFIKTWHDHILHAIRIRHDSPT